MAQLAPPAQLPKHPAPTSSNPNGSANVSSFIPRKEFIPQQRVISSFSLLALSSANLVRLYGFPPSVISALRRVFDHQNLIISVSEDAPKNFFQFCLDRRPWASPKSPESEELLVAVLSAILQCGYSFLSSIDYGREPDDRLAIAFSKPTSVASSSGQIVSGSLVTLNQPVRALFAISFVSPSVLRVVNPPLHSTPAILQAVRASWPRGVVSEKRFGEATYQFKLKGYKFFQEDTYPTDSLQQILTLLSTLDSHTFALLTSLTLTSRSRKQDLWMFTGPSEDAPSSDSPHPSPGTSSLELRGDNTQYAAQASNEKLAPIAPGFRAGATAPATSSPLKPISPHMLKAQGNMLRKASPQVQIPLAYIADADSATNSPVDNKQHPFSSSMGSVDMTGVGSGRGKGGERLSRSPDVLYMTAGVPGYAQNYNYRDEHAALQAVGQAFPPTQGAITPGFAGGEHGMMQRFQPQDTSSSTSHSRSRSAEASFPQPIASTPPSIPFPSGISPQSSTQPTEIVSPAPVQASGQDYFGNARAIEHGQDGSRQDKNGGSPRAAPPDLPRTPTPPLLTPGVFRDSAFSSTTGRTSFNIPIAWSGRDPEPSRATLAEIKEEEDEGRERERSRERQSPRPFLVEHASAGPMPPGAWTSTPKDERRHDDVSNMLPPTIQEYPSQERDDIPHTTSKGDQGSNGQAVNAPLVSRFPESTNTDRDRTRRDRGPSPTDSSNRQNQNSARAGPVAELKRRQSPTRRESDSSGWVIVNIDRGDRANQDGKGKTRQAQSVSPDPSRRTRSPTANTGSGATSPHRPLPHKRSSSDSRLHRSPQGASKDSAAAMSSMHPAAKAIVIIDAVGAKEKEHEKSGSGSGFKRIFARGRDKGQSAQSTQTSVKSSDASRRPLRTVGSGVNEKSRQEHERDQRMKERWKSHSTSATRSGTN